MKFPTIEELISEWVDTHGRPIWGGIRIGPGRCGIGRCMAMHAHAVTVKNGGISWTYERPCDGHWSGRYEEGT